MTVLTDTTKNARRSLTPWELPSLLTPVHSYRHSTRKAGPERPHFPAILGFVYRNRFAVASQIGRRFADVLKSERTTRRHLEELEALGYLGLAPTCGLSPLFPKVYYVTGRGVKKLQASLAAQGKPWKAVRVDRCGRHSQEGYSADRTIHELLITEFLLGTRETIAGRSDLDLLTTQRRSLARHPAFHVATAGRSSRLVPDAMFLFRQRDGGMVCCLLEMDLGTMNVKQIRQKYRRYAAWSASQSGQQYLIDLYRTHGAQSPRPTFRLLMVARDRSGQDDHRRLRELYAAAKGLPTAMQDRLWFASVADMQSHQRDSLPLAAPLWIRGRTLRLSAVNGTHGADVSDECRGTAHGGKVGHAELHQSLFPMASDVGDDELEPGKPSGLNVDA